MFAILAGSAFVRSLLRVTGLSVARETNSEGCGWLAIMALLAFVAIFVM
jgi:hypothetical protein